MEHDIPELLKKMMETMGGGQVDLAKRLGGRISQPDVSRWLGGAEPKGKNYQRIIALANELGLFGDVRSEDVAADLHEHPKARTVPIKGYVGASGEAFYYRVADEDFEEVEAPKGSSDKTIAVEIRGKSFGPLVDSWLVFYDDVRSPVTEDLIGKTCVIGLADDRIVLKEIQRDGRGGYRLLSNSGEDAIEGVAIEWAAKVTSMRQR